MAKQEKVRKTQGPRAGKKGTAVVIAKDLPVVVAALQHAIKTQGFQQEASYVAAAALVARLEARL